MKYNIDVPNKTIGIYPLKGLTVFDLFDSLEGLKKLYPDFNDWKVAFLTQEEQDGIDLGGLSMPSIIPGS